MNPLQAQGAAASEVRKLRLFVLKFTETCNSIARIDAKLRELRPMLSADCAKVIDETLEEMVQDVADAFQTHLKGVAS